MDTETFNAIIQQQMDWCMQKLLVKAVEYAGIGEDVDRLHNFRVTAELRDTDMRDALSGMMAKHTVSVYDMCNAIDLDDLSQWDEKIGDHINYLLLLRAIVQEEYWVNQPKDVTHTANDEIQKMDAVANAVYHYFDTKTGTIKEGH
jgi:hypothetical protein